MPENLDFVRSILATVARGDHSAADLASPAIDYVVADEPDPAGATDAKLLISTMRRADDDWCDVLEDHASPTTACSCSSSRAEKGKRPRVDQNMAQLFEIDHSKVARIIAYFDRQRGPAELGLAE